MIVSVATEKVRLAVLVAHTHQLLQAIHRELAKEVKEEVACIRIVTVAENRFAIEMLFVVPHLFFDVRELCIKLVLLCCFSADKFTFPLVFPAILYHLKIRWSYIILMFPQYLLLPIIFLKIRSKRPLNHSSL